MDPDRTWYPFEKMPQGRRLHRYTYAEYAALERESPTKHEFLDGEIYAMAGRSEDHSALAAEVIRALGNALGDRPCRVHTSDLRIYVEAVGLATFPDGAVVCGALEQHEPSPDATAPNPLVLIEVTSDSSAEYDTSGKLEAYRTIPSLRDYVDPGWPGPRRERGGHAGRGRDLPPQRDRLMRSLSRDAVLCQKSIERRKLLDVPLADLLDAP
jgi:Uma2 family endonuclease